MKRRVLIACTFALLAGFFLGILCPASVLPWTDSLSPDTSALFSAPFSSGSISSSAGSTQSGMCKAAFDTKDNRQLLDVAYAVLHAMQDEDYDELAALVHPKTGVTFTPYSTVDFDLDLTFSSAQIKGLSKDNTVYSWGIRDGKGDLIRLTMKDYFSQFVYNMDYSLAPEIGIDRIIISGNALENITSAYSDCRFVDFCYPSLDAANSGPVWSSLKLVFQSEGDCWYLVGVVHGEWTT